MGLRWLGNPYVALVSFLASVATLGHITVVTARGACRFARATGNQLYVSLAPPWWLLRRWPCR